jgi:arsenate reductase (thioredoxin)
VNDSVAAVVTPRLLILCTANSARSQMSEGWARFFAAKQAVALDVHSAGTKATKVNPNAIAAMQEVGIDLSNHHSKTLYEVPDPWNFTVVLTVCDHAAANCPVYPAKSIRIHHGFPDPAGESDEPAAFRRVRDLIKPFIEQLVWDFKAGKYPAQ